jgi:hypothetical protein
MRIPNHSDCDSSLMAITDSKFTPIRLLRACNWDRVDPGIRWRRLSRIAYLPVVLPHRLAASAAMWPARVVIRVLRLVRAESSWY